MSITFGNLSALAKKANAPLLFEHRGGATTYWASAFSSATDPGLLLLAPVSGGTHPIMQAGAAAYSGVNFHQHISFALLPISASVRYFSQSWENDPVTVLHLAQGTKGALRKRVVTRIEVAFGDDQDVYLKAVLSDPLPLP